MNKLIQIAALALLGLTLAFQSCKKDPEPPGIYVSPAAIYATTVPGGLIEYRVTAVAGDNELRNVLITAKPENSITTTLKDTSVYGNEAEFFFVYQAPPSGTDNIVLTFRVYDREGESNAVLRSVTVEGNAYLEQTTGHQIYSVYNLNSLNAFDISETEPLNLETAPDTTLIDLVEFDLSDDDEISRAWTSYSGIRFVRNNDFNYAEATNVSAAASFTSSTPQSIISNLQLNDILITEYDTLAHKYAVIRIVNVTDEAGIGNDRYEFNLKK